jgi:hypothetical protein
MKAFSVRTSDCSAMKKYRLDRTDFLTAGTKVISKGKTIFTFERDYPIPFLIPPPQNKFEEERLHGAAHAYLDYLYTSCLRNNRKAARKFHEFVTVVLDHFQIADQVRPELFRSLKRSALKWPSFASPNKMIQSYQDQFTRELAQTPPLKSHGKQASPDKIETLVAWNLFHLIEPNRTMKGRLLGKPDSVTRFSMGLPRLTRRTFSQWKKAMEAALIEEFGSNFEQNRIFKNYWGKSAEHLSKKESKKQRGLIRREIKKRVFQALYTLAPDS